MAGLVERQKLTPVDDALDGKQEAGPIAMIIRAALLATLLLFLIAVLLVRFQKRRLATFHRLVTNRITIRFASRLPGFGVVMNVGRKSRKQYRTPVSVFRIPGGFLVALTYGRDSDWVKNVLAAGSCQIETRRLIYDLTAPALIHDPSRRRFPLVVRFVLSLIDANDLLQLSEREVSAEVEGRRLQEQQMN